MRYLEGRDLSEALKYIEIAAELALGAGCLRAKAGAIIVNNSKLVGQGYNSPPGDIILTSCLKDSLPKDFKSDRTCCMHAEERAIINGLTFNHSKIEGSRLYFIRLDDSGHKAPAGKPYCTICSKMALEVKISEFVLMHKEGVAVYGTKEYNDLSFEYNGG